MKGDQSDLDTDTRHPFHFSLFTFYLSLVFYGFAT